MKKIRILIADDHDIVRRGLRPLIESEYGWEVCGEAVTGREAVAMAESLKPDIVILDVGMPEVNGVEATRQIRQARAETEVLAFTGTESESLVHQLFAAGARACVLKSEAGDQLIPAIKALSQHRPYLASRISQAVFERYLQGGLAPDDDTPGGLSARERETIRLLAEGKSNKEVAAAVGISVKTVESHRAAIMRKLGFTSFSDLVRYAVRNHIVAP
jgi:DNA-binding NarL/FixJ family response regulator